MIQLTGSSFLVNVDNSLLYTLETEISIKLKRINFINPKQDIRAKELLNFLWSINGSYDYDAKPRFEQLGYYVPKEQYDAYLQVLDIQYDLEQEGNQ